MLATTPSRSTPGAGLTEAGSDYRALAEYFDALYFCDVETLRRVFHPRAIYATADERPLLYRTMEEYTAVVAARQSPASRGEPRRDRVDFLDLAGENTAMARVRCSIGRAISWIS